MSQTDDKKNTVHQGRNVRIAREFKGLSQESLGFYLNKQQSEISKIENQAIVNDEMLNQIALALDVSPDFLKSFDLEDVVRNYNNSSSYLFNDEAHDNKSEQDQIENQYIYYPIDQFKDFANDTLKMQKELLEEKHQIDKENALLKQEIKFLKNKK